MDADGGIAIRSTRLSGGDVCRINHVACNDGNHCVHLGLNKVVRNSAHQLGACIQVLDALIERLRLLVGDTNSYEPGLEVLFCVNILSCNAIRSSYSSFCA